MSAAGRRAHPLVFVNRGRFIEKENGLFLHILSLLLRVKYAASSIVFVTRTSSKTPAMIPATLIMCIFNKLVNFPSARVKNNLFDI